MSLPHHLKNTIDALPREPGVYLFKLKEDVLYIGKATSLRDRVKSYFNNNLPQQRNSRVVRAIQVMDSIEYIQTSSVIEALILESQLIKKIQPLANTREKDDKSYLYVIITKEAYPRVYIIRGKELQIDKNIDNIRNTFGPFTNGRALKEALSIIRNIFPFRGEKDPLIQKKRIHSALNQQLGLTPNIEALSRIEYIKNIRNVELFFQGKKNKLIKTLERDMKRYAQLLKFEQAERVKRSLWAIQHIKDSSLIRDDFNEYSVDISYRIEAYDIAHMMGSHMVGVMTVIDQKVPQKQDYRRFIIKTVHSKSDDTKALAEILERRFKHNEWNLPKLIVIDGGKGQYNTAKKVLDSFGYAIPIVAVTKGKGHKPKGYIGDIHTIKDHEEEILLANSEAHRLALTFHQQKRMLV